MRISRRLKLFLFLFSFLFFINFAQATDCRLTMTLYDPNDNSVDSCNSDYVNETGLINVCNIGYQKCLITGMYYLDIEDNCSSISQSEDLYMCDATPPSEKSTTSPYFDIEADNTSNFFKADWKVYDKGLVLYMPFEVNNGNVVQDESPQNNSGTAVNGPTIVNGNAGNGYAMHFDGVNDYVNVSDDASLNITGEFTLSSWINTNDNNSTAPSIEQNYEDGITTYWSNTGGTSTNQAHQGTKSLYAPSTSTTLFDYPEGSITTPRTKWDLWVYVPTSTTYRRWYIYSHGSSTINYAVFRFINGNFDSYDGSSYINFATYNQNAWNHFIITSRPGSKIIDVEVNGNSYSPASRNTLSSGSYMDYFSFVNENFDLYIDSFVFYGGLAPDVIKKGNAYGLGATQNKAIMMVNGAINTTNISSGWHYVTVAHNSSHKNVFVDGDLKSSQSVSGSITTNTEKLLIGSGFNGSIDEVKIYNRSLNATEVIDLYMSGLTRHELEYSTTTTGDYSSSHGLREDFSGTLSNWAESGGAANWTNPSSILRSEPPASDGFGYYKQSDFNITGKDVLVDFDIKYSGAKRGGIVYRNQTCEISPSGTGWGNTIIGEVGNITIYNTSDYYNVTVNFQNLYANPTIVAYIMSRENTESLEVRVMPENNSYSRNATFFIMKPENSGSMNHPEKVGYIVMETGRHVLPDGTIVEAGRSLLTSSHNGSAGESYTGQTISFDTEFNKTPVVLHSLISNYNKEFATSAVWGITTKNFSSAIELAETNSANRSEYLGWIAIEANVTGVNNGVKYETGKDNDGTNDGVDDTAHAITYSQSFSSTPFIVVSQDSANGLDGSWARASGTNTNTQHGVYAEEDQVKDSERSHPNETFGYWAFENTTNITGLTRGISSGSWQHMRLYIWGKNSSNVYSSLSFGAEGYFSNEKVKGPFTDDRFGFVSPYSTGYYQVDNLKIIDLHPGLENNITEATDTTPPGQIRDLTVNTLTDTFGTNHMSWGQDSDEGTTFSFYMQDYDTQDNPSNGIRNSDFEDMKFSPWAGHGTSDFNVTSIYHYGGNWSLNVSAGIGGGVEQDIENYAYYNGETVLFSCMARSDSGTLEVSMSASGINETQLNHDLTTTWKEIQFSGTVNGTVTVIINTTTSSGNFYIDDCKFHEVLRKTVTAGTKDYYVTETSGGYNGDDSGWQSGLEYNDSGLYCFQNYCYNVKARDNALNVGIASSDVCNYPIPSGKCAYGSGADGYCLTSGIVCYYKDKGTTGCPNSTCFSPGTITSGNCYYDKGTTLDRSDDCTSAGCTGVSSVSAPSCTNGSINDNAPSYCWNGYSCNYTSSDPCQADTDGWDWTTATTLCSAGNFECCNDTTTYLDNVNCTTAGPTYTAHERDSAKVYCEASAVGCTPYTWSSVASKCCGDDASEGFTEAKFEGGACVNSLWHSDHCSDGIQDGEETGVDSGGPWCEDVPSDPSVTLNSSSGTNKTNENLTAYYSITDNDYDEVFPIIDWRKNSNSIAVLNLPFQVNNGSNAITKDYSTYQNNGTVHGAEWTKYGLIGGAYQFNGVDDYINVSDSSSLDFGMGDFSIVVWVKDTGTLSAAPIIAKTGNVGSSNGWNIIENSGQYRLRIGNGTTAVTVYSGAFSYNTWHLLVGLRDGDYLKIYLDGSFKDSTPGASAIDINSNGYDTVIAKALGYDYFNGSIDEVRVYNYSLSSEQIYQMYMDEVNHHSNLVLNMPFKRNTTYNATGWVEDYSQFSNKGRLGDGVSNWAPVWNSTGQIGGSYWFDGVYDYINISDSASLSPTQQITISVWVKD